MRLHAAFKGGLTLAYPKQQYTTVSCQQCGSEFSVPPSKLDKKFCSRQCYYESRKGIVLPHMQNNKGENNPNWRGVRVEIECHHCKQKFRRRFVDQKYCSMECASKEHGDKISGVNNPNHTLLVTKTCEFCGNEFKVTPYKSTIRKYCSLQCSNQGLLLGNETSLEKAVREQLEGLKINFIAQQPFDLYTVDFLLPDYNLVIECDGEYWHSSPSAQNRDRRKDAYLRRIGYRVVRLSEKEIQSDPARAVRRALQEVNAIAN